MCVPWFIFILQSLKLATCTHSFLKLVPSMRDLKLLRNRYSLSEASRHFCISFLFVFFFFYVLTITNSSWHSTAFMSRMRTWMSLCCLVHRSLHILQSHLALRWRLIFHLIGAFAGALIASTVPLKGQDGYSTFPLSFLPLFTCRWCSSELWPTAWLTSLALLCESGLIRLGHFFFFQN